jgi:hypothetical protein
MYEYIQRTNATSNILFTACFLLAWLNMNMVAMYSSEISMNFYVAMQCHDPKFSSSS